MFRLLKEGDTVGIVAPASPATAARIEPAVAWLESSGYRVRLGASIGQSDRFLAGTDVDRARDLVDMFSDAAIGAVFAARGGYGSSRLLDLIDWSIVGANTKPFVGFSDTTALQFALYQKTGMVSLTGFVLASDASEGPPAADIESDLSGALRRGSFDPVRGLSHDHSLSGKLVGGCLSLVVHLIGTPYFPALEGHILMLEDVGESPYRVDRMLTHLILSRTLEKATAVLFGTFHKCRGDEEDGTVDDVLADFSLRSPCPVVTGLPYGHGPVRRVLPIGATVQISDGTMMVEGWERRIG